MAAIRMARAAQPEWAAMELADRLKPVAHLRRTLGQRPEAALATLLGPNDQGAAPTRADRAAPADHGDPARRAEALSSQVIPLADACAFLQRSAADLLAPRRPGSDGRPGWLAGVDLEVARRPWGVVLVLAASNYPLFLPGVQVIQALTAGNAVLLKPGEGGTAAARWLAAELAAGGLPPGLLTVLPEDPYHAREAVEEGIDKVCLTGSAATGRALLADLAPHLTPATLELSGNDALLALEDADPRTVARALAFGLRLNGSATCIAPRRAFVHRSSFEAVEAALVEELGALRGADVGSRMSTTEGAGVSPRPDRHEPHGPPGGGDLERGRRLVAAAVDAGGRLLRHCAGSPPAPIPLDRPELSPPPWVVTGAPPDAELRTTALFAPVLTLDPVDDVDEAVRRANASPYALGASVFGPAAAARAVAGRLAAGVVTVNDLIVPTADPRLPFGGRGRSGYGVTRGAEGLLAMTVPRAVTERRLPGGLAARFARPHRHFEAPVPQDEALFAAWLRVAHGGALAARLKAVPALVRALAARARAGGAAPHPDDGPSGSPSGGSRSPGRTATDSSSPRSTEPHGGDSPAEGATTPMTPSTPKTQSSPHQETP